MTHLFSCDTNFHIGIPDKNHVNLIRCQPFPVNADEFLLVTAKTERALSHVPFLSIATPLVKFFMVWVIRKTVDSQQLDCYN